MFKIHDGLKLFFLSLFLTASSISFAQTFTTTISTDIAPDPDQGNELQVDYMCQIYNYTITVKNNSNVSQTRSIIAGPTDFKAIRYLFYYQNVVEKGDFDIIYQAGGVLKEDVQFNPNETKIFHYAAKATPPNYSFQNISFKGGVGFMIEVIGTPPFIQTIESVTEIVFPKWRQGPNYIAPNYLSSYLNISNINGPAGPSDNFPFFSAGFSDNHLQSVLCEDGFSVDINYSYTDNGQTRSALVINDNGVIEVKNGATFTLRGTDIGICDNMWRGIIVESGGSLFMDNCTIYGAEYGVTALPGSNVSIRNSTFTNCYVGVYVPPSLTGEIQNLSLVVDNCTFNTIGAMPRSFHVPILTHGFAGVSVSDCVLAAIGTDRGNKFVNLNFGIYATGTNLEAYSNSFTNISNYDNVNGGIGINAIGYNYTVLNVKKGNSHLSPPSYFTNCEVGVMSNANTTLVKGCIMNSVGSGILVFGNYLSGVSLQNNYINARTRGIFTTWNFGLTYAKIDENNQISMDGNDHAVGIEIADISLGGEGWNIENNQVAMSKGDVAIAYRSGDRAKIIENSVDMSPLNKNVYTGILVEKNAGVILKCNNIQGKTATGFSDNEAIFIKSSPTASVTCNSVDNNERGIRSMDLNDNKYGIRGNTIRHHLFGLYVDDNSSIGRQNLNGNRWLGPFDLGGAGAIHKGFKDKVESSQFFINGSSCSPLWPCTVLTPNANGIAWFSTAPGTNFQCSSNGIGCTPPGVAPVVMDSYTRGEEEHLRNGTYGNGTPFVNELNWKGKAHFYENVMNVSPNDLNYSEAIFVTNENNSSIGQLYQVKSSLSNAVKGLSSESNAFTTNQQAILNQLTTINNTDMLLAANPTDAVLIAQKQSQLVSLKTTTITQKGVANTLKLHRQSAIQQAKLQNLQVNATVLPATNQKVVNSIILELVGGDYYNLSSSQINQLQSIANQCPMEGGDAVYEARSILRKASPNSTYNDGIICGGASPRATKEDISKYEATIYPNPASEAVKVSFNGLHPTSLELYDVMGKKVLTSKVNEHSTEEIINTSQLLGGIYQLILYEGKSKLQTIKMIVIR